MNTIAQIDLGPVTSGIESVRDSVLVAAAQVAAVALSLFGVMFGARYLRRLLKSFADGERWTDEDRAEYERVGREVELGNNMRGMAPGWGAFHGQRGSGLQRGRRSR